MVISLLKGTRQKGLELKVVTGQTALLTVHLITHYLVKRRQGRDEDKGRMIEIETDYVVAHEHISKTEKKLSNGHLSVSACSDSVYNWMIHSFNLIALFIKTWGKKRGGTSRNRVGSWRSSALNVCSVSPIIEHFIMCLALFLVVCVFVWSFLSLEGQRKSGLPNQAQINGTRPTLKITYSRRAIHFKICLPQNLSHFLCPLQSTRNSHQSAP